MVVDSFSPKWPLIFLVLLEGAVVASFLLSWVVAVYVFNFSLFDPLFSYARPFAQHKPLRLKPNHGLTTVDEPHGMILIW